MFLHGLRFSFCLQVAALYEFLPGLPSVIDLTGSKTNPFLLKLLLVMMLYQAIETLAETDGLRVRSRMVVIFEGL